MWKLIEVAISFLVIFTVTIECAKGGTSYEIAEGTGTIKYLSMEGGFYGISGDDNKNYDPINLPKEFQKDGLRIRFKAKIRSDMASYHMWGMLIELIKIEKLR